MADTHERCRARRLRASIEGLEDRCLLSPFGRGELAHPSRIWATSPTRVGHTESPAPSVRTIEVVQHPHAALMHLAMRSRRAASPQVGFSQATFDVKEDAGAAVIAVTRTGNVKSRVTVTVATTASGTAVPGVNYTPSVQTLTFRKGVRTQTFSVPVLDDHLFDSDFTVGLALSAPKGKVALGGASVATLVIENVDPWPAAEFQFSATSYEVDDNAGTAGIQVTRSVDSQVPVTVTVATTSGGTAVPGVNFTPTVQTLTFGAGVDTQTFDVPVLDDHALHPDLTVGLALSAGGECGPGQPVRRHARHPQPQPGARGRVPVLGDKLRGG